MASQTSRKIVVLRHRFVGVLILKKWTQKKFGYLSKYTHNKFLRQFETLVISNYEARLYLYL